MAKQVTKYESDGVTPAQASYDEGTVRDGQQTTPRRIWWKNTSTAGEILAGSQFTRVQSGANDGLSFLEIAADVPITPPAAPIATPTAGAELGVGAYTYAITQVASTGETTVGAQAQVTTTPGNQQVALSGIPLGPAGTIARRIYRTAVDDSTLLFVAEIPDNTTTDYVDAIPDASLGAQPPSLNTSGGPGTWGTADIVIGDMAVGDWAGCWMRYDVPAGTPQIGNPRRAYVQFEEA
jgi:hypothetical protein